MRSLLLGLIVSLVAIPAFSQRAVTNFGGAWKLESPSNDVQYQADLALHVQGDKISGTLKLPYGEFPVSNASIEGADIFFNVVISRDGYVLKTSYRGHFYNDEIQFRVEAGERNLMLLARRPEVEKK